MPAACFKSVTLSGGSHATNCIAHNDRTNAPDYLLPEDQRGENQAIGVVISPEDLIAQVKANEKTFGRKLNGRTKLFREAVILIDKDTDNADIDTCIKRLGDELGMTMLWHFEHNDEGHIDADGITRKNHHIHFGYTFYDLDNHRSHPNNADVMRKAQDIVSESLKLERGVSKKESKRSGLSHQQYRRMKNESRELAQEQEKDQAQVKDENKILKAKFAEIRTELVATQAATKDHYAELNQIKKSEEDLQTKLDQMAVVVNELTESLEAEKLRATQAEEQTKKFKSVADKTVEWMTAARDRLVGWFKSDIKLAKTNDKLKEIKTEIDNHEEIQRHEPSKKDLDNALKARHKELNPITRSRGR